MPATARWQLTARTRTAARGTFILMTILFIWLTEGTAAVGRRAPAQSRPTDVAQIKEKLANLYGPGVVAASDRRQFFWPGDFNGDAAEDLLVLINIERFQKGSHPNVTVLNPWDAEAKDNSASPTLGLAIIHGTVGQNSSAAPTAFLLTDRDFFSTPIWGEKSGDPLIALQKRNPAKGRRNPNLPKAARGDCVTIATEAGIDMILYWDGKTYKLFAPQEEP